MISANAVNLVPASTVMTKKELVLAKSPFARTVITSIRKVVSLRHVVAVSHVK